MSLVVRFLNSGLCMPASARATERSLKGHAAWSEWVTVFISICFSPKLLFVHGGFSSHTMLILAAACCMSVEELCIRTGMPWLYNEDNIGRILKELVISETVSAVAILYGPWVAVCGGYVFWRIKEMIRPASSDIDFFLLNACTNTASPGYDRCWEPIRQILAFLAFVLDTSLFIEFDADSFERGGHVYDRQEGKNIVRVSKCPGPLHVPSKFDECIRKSKAGTAAERVFNNQENAILLAKSVNSVLAENTTSDIRSSVFERAVICVKEYGVNIDLISNKFCSSKDEGFHSGGTIADLLPYNHYKVMANIDLNVCRVCVSPSQEDHSPHSVRLSHWGFEPHTIAEIYMPDPPLRISKSSFHFHHKLGRTGTEVCHVALDYKRVLKYLARGCKLANPILNSQTVSALQWWRASGKFAPEESDSPKSTKEYDEFFNNNRRDIFKMVMSEAQYKKVATKVNQDQHYLCTRQVDRAKYNATHVYRVELDY
jgi:hypothetical protein